MVLLQWTLLGGCAACFLQTSSGCTGLHFTYALCLPSVAKCHAAGNPVSNMLRTDAGTAVFVVTLVLTIGCCVFWCRRKCGHRWPIKLCCGHNTCCCIDYGEKRRQAKLRRQENSSNSDEERGWGRWREERHRSRDAHSDDSASVVVMRSQRRGKKSRDRDGEEFGVHGQGRARAYAVGGAQHQLEVGQGALPAGVLGLNPGAAGATLITNQMAAMLAASMMQQQQPLQLPAPLQPQPQLQLQPYQAASPFLPQHMYQMALGQTGMLQGLDHHHHHHRPRRSMSTGFDPVAEGNSSRHVHSRRQEQARNRDGGGGGGGSSSSRRYRRGDAGGPAGPEVTPRGGHHHHHHNHHHSPQRGANKEAPSPSHTHGSRSHPGHPSAPAAAAVGQWKKYDNPLIDPLVARQRQVRSAPPVKSGGMGGAGSQGVRLQAPQPAARTARAGTR